MTIADDHYGSSRRACIGGMGVYKNCAGAFHSKNSRVAVEWRQESGSDR